jgi:transcriptional regulator with XRE-family HTH domain
MSIVFMSIQTHFCPFPSKIGLDMNDDASIFWENVKREIKSQNTTHEWVAKNSGISFNTFQGWISKGIYPRVNEAIRIAASLNTSVEYLANGAVQNSKKPIETIYQHLPKIQEHLEFIKDAVKELQ